MPVILAAFVTGVLAMPSFAAATTSPPPAGVRTESPAPDTVAAKELARKLAGPEEHRPVLLHIGFRRLYRAGHIPGSRYAGAASTPEGLTALRAAMRGVPTGREVVIYCGCCPWKDCPNVPPAIGELRRLGFEKVRALYLPKDFFTDWADQQLPVVKGN